VSRRARNHAQEALQLGLQEAANTAAAHALLADYFLQVEKWDEALRHLDQAVGASHTMSLAGRAHLHYLRALTHRRRNHYQLAQQDIDQAISFAQQAGQEQAVTRYTSERELIMRHQGR
jgi:tetratricopeptide (TPR) repeat protein